MNDLIIHAAAGSVVNVNYGSHERAVVDDPGWTAVTSIDVQRDGDAIQLWFNMADGRQVPLASHPLLTRIRIPFASDTVRVRGNPRVETKPA